MKLAHLCRCDAPPAAVLIRWMVGLMFASEGLQKFLYTDTQGVGRFTKIGIPAPELMGPFVGILETTCGALLVIGLTTRLAALPLVMIMVMALASTKLPILIGRGYWIFSHTFAPKVGVWAFLHESRTDLALLSSTSFLTLVGGDRLSLDAYLRGIAATRQPPEQPLE